MVHFKVSGWILSVLGIVVVVFGLSVPWFWGSFGEVPVVGLFLALTTGAFIAACGGVLAMAGTGLLDRRPYARTLVTFLGSLYVLVGLYLLWSQMTNPTLESLQVPTLVALANGAYFLWAMLRPRAALDWSNYLENREGEETSAEPVRMP